MAGALRFIATICAALFAGAALYISVVEQPARLLATMDVALGEFRPGFPRAHSNWLESAASTSSATPA